MPAASWDNLPASEWVDGPATHYPEDAARYQFGIETRTGPSAAGYTHALKYRIHYTADSDTPQNRGSRMMWMTPAMIRELQRFLQKWLIDQGQANAGN